MGPILLVLTCKIVITIRLHCINTNADHFNYLELLLQLFKGLVEFSFILRKLFISPIHLFPFLHQLNYLPIRFILVNDSRFKIETFEFTELLNFK